MTSKTEAPNSAASVAREANAPEMPEEIDFSRGLRGQAGHDVLVRLARYRRALLTIRDMQGVEDDSLRAVLTMQAAARQALEDRPA